MVGKRPVTWRKLPDPEPCSVPGCTKFRRRDSNSTVCKAHMHIPKYCKCRTCTKPKKAAPAPKPKPKMVYDIPVKVVHVAEPGIHQNPHIMAVTLPKEPWL